MLSILFFWAITLASISQPSLECSKKLNPLFIKQIGKGAQGTVFLGHNGVVIKRIGRHIFNSNAFIPRNINKSLNYEKEILEELNVLVNEKKATGFVKLKEVVKCGQVQDEPYLLSYISFHHSSTRLKIHPSSRVEYTYLIMEKLDGVLNDELSKKTPSVDSYISYLAQTLTALDVAYKEKRFVSRDLHLNNIMIVKDFKRCSDSYGYYRYHMPDLTIDIPRSYSCGKNIKIIDVGLSAIDDKKGKRISYTKEWNIPKEHLGDLFYIAIDFLTPNVNFFREMKEKRPSIYQNLNDLYQHIFHPNQMPLFMAHYGFRKFFKVYKKFDIISWKEKYNANQQNRAFWELLRLTKTFWMKKPWFTINDAIHHKLFKTLFSEQKNIDPKEITIIGRTDKYVKPYKKNYVRNFSHLLAYWYGKIFN